MQPKIEPEKFNLEEEKAHETAIQDEIDEKLVEFDEETPDHNVSVINIENQSNNIIFERSPKAQNTEKSIFSIKRRLEQKKKVKAEKPLSEPNIDGWFYKNFGIAKLFEDEDSSME